MAICKPSGYHLIVTKILKHPLSKELACIVLESRIIPGTAAGLVHVLVHRKLQKDEWIHLTKWECKGGWSDSRPLTQLELEELDLAVSIKRKKIKEEKLKKFVNSAARKIEFFKEVEKLKALGLPSDLEFIPIHSVDSED